MVSRNSGKRNGFQSFFDDLFQPVELELFLSLYFEYGINDSKFPFWHLLFLQFH